MSGRVSTLMLGNLHPPMAPLDILVVEDSRSDRLILETYLRAQGHRVRGAESGERALELFDPAAVDLILMDVLLPGMDGIEATHRLRARCTERWVPVILLSLLQGEDQIVRGLEGGADDYLVKPVNLVVLGAKLRSFQRISGMNRELAASALMLARYREEAEAELELAKVLIGGMMQHDALRDPALTWSVTPSRRFSGDTVAAFRTSSGRLLALLADATGHGLAAAISLLPLLQVFYGMARKDLPLTEIVCPPRTGLERRYPGGDVVARARGAGRGDAALAPPAHGYPGGQRVRRGLQRAGHRGQGAPAVLFGWPDRGGKSARRAIRSAAPAHATPWLRTGGRIEAGAGGPALPPRRGRRAGRHLAADDQAGLSNQPGTPGNQLGTGARPLLRRNTAPLCGRRPAWKLVDKAVPFLYVLTRCCSKQHVPRQ
jgi:CheY-like chemotaxis protein